MRQLRRQFIKRLSSLKRQQWLWPSVVILSGVVGWGIYKTELFAGAWGIRNDEVAVVAIERDSPSGQPKSITVVAPNKSIWDASQLILVPFVLVVLGYSFQEKQRNQDADENREEVLQLYFDRVSALLINKNLMVIAATKESIADDQEGLLKISTDVIKARTLSILRRFEEDSDRKSSVIRFLVEAGVMKLDIDLKNTNLSGINISETYWPNAELQDANLCDADLCNAELHYSNMNYAKLRGAKLRGAEFSEAFLIEADLRDADLFEAQFASAWLMEADLRGADLRGANLSLARLNGADLRGANLSGAIFAGTNLHGADLRRAKNVTEKQLKTAQLCKTQLPDSVDMKSDRDCIKCLSDYLDRKYNNRQSRDK